VLKLKLTQEIIPAIASAVPLVLTLGSAPTIAATFASSEATVTINNFSHNPFDSDVITDTFTNVFAANGSSVNTDTDAAASFVTAPATAFNSSFSSSDGTGNEYTGTADSFAGVLGNFNINSGETFSFDFDASLSLATSIDNPQTEFANASGTVSFTLYDTSNVDNWILLDSFEISSNIATTGNDFLNFDDSNSNQFTFNDVSLNPNFGGDREGATASTEGIFSRTFDRAANLTLVEVKENSSSVAVPEPSIIFGTMLGFLAVGYRAWSKRTSID
jgi:hypothetical protein